MPKRWNLNDSARTGRRHQDAAQHSWHTAPVADEAFPEPGKRPEPSRLQMLRLVAMYLEFAVGAMALLSGAVLGTLAFVRGGHGAPYVLLASAMLVITGGLLVLGALALRRRHPLWWIPHLMLIVPILADLMSTKLG